MNKSLNIIILLSFISAHALAQQLQYNNSAQNSTEGNIRYEANGRQIFQAGFMRASRITHADEWREAERQIVRLTATEFKSLPRNIAEELNVQGCTIPQVDGYNEPHNVIRGSFAAPGLMDWAVLCSRKGESVISVFWGGPVQCPSQMALGKDAHWLQTTGDGRVSYSRLINSIDKKTIVEYQKGFGAPEAPVLTDAMHQGIDDYFMGKASVIHYCSYGQWLKLSGAD